MHILNTVETLVHFKVRVLASVCVLNLDIIILISFGIKLTSFIVKSFLRFRPELCFFWLRLSLLRLRFVFLCLLNFLRASAVIRRFFLELVVLVCWFLVLGAQKLLDVWSVELLLI